MTKLDEIPKASAECIEAAAHFQVVADAERQRIFRMEHRLVRDEF